MKTGKSSLKDLAKKWGVLAIGVSLTIFSAIISNYSIEKNNDAINDFEYKADRAGQLIAEIWQNSRSLESRKDNAITLNVISPEHPNTILYTQETLRLLGHESGEQDTFVALNEAFDSYKESIGEQVNDKYFEQQSYLSLVKETKGDNDVLLNLALCLQFLGIIFVLSKGYY